MNLNTGEKGITMVVVGVSWLIETLYKADLELNFTKALYSRRYIRVQMHRLDGFLWKAWVVVNGTWPSEQMKTQSLEKSWNDYLGQRVRKHMAIQPSFPEPGLLMSWSLQSRGFSSQLPSADPLVNIFRKQRSGMKRHLSVGKEICVAILMSVCCQLTLGHSEGLFYETSGFGGCS